MIVAINKIIELLLTSIISLAGAVRHCVRVCVCVCESVRVVCARVSGSFSFLRMVSEKLYSIVSFWVVKMPTNSV